MYSVQSTQGPAYDSRSSETDALLLRSPDIGIKTADIQSERGHAVGSKTLNGFYSFVFIINQIYGPGVLAIPIVFQQAGWLVTTLMLGFFFIISSFSSTLLTEASSLIPGNKQFDKHIEYTGIVKYYFGPRWYFVFQIFLNICMQSYNISSIVICAASVDQFILYVFKKTYAFEIFPHFGFIATGDFDAIYNGPQLCITLGYVLIAAVCLPAGFLNLDDNVKVVQLMSFLALVVLMTEFCVQFAITGIHIEYVPMIGTTYTQVVSVFIFSWASVMFVPSWVNEKRDGVSVNRVIWTSGICSFFGYLFIGLLAAMSFQNIRQDNILTILGNPGSTSTITLMASYAFSLGVIAPGIPVCCITTRYNLYVGHVCGRKTSYFWGVVAPWLVAFLATYGTNFANLLNWSSLVFNGFVNFVVPMVLYYRAITLQRKEFKNIQAEAPRSTVNPWPTFCRKYMGPLFWTMLMIVTTCLFIILQIGEDLFYLIILGKNILGGS